MHSASVGTLCLLSELKPVPAVSPAVDACRISRIIRCVHCESVSTLCPLGELRPVPAVSPPVEACRISRIV
jgi:hypothetical protein